MSLTVTDGVPANLTAGDAASFRYSTSLYAAPDWTAQLVIHDSVGNVRTFDATADGSIHLFSLTNAHTAILKPGRATATVVLTDGTNRQSDYPQQIWIEANPSITGVPTTAEKVVSELEATILKLSTGSSETVSFNGQSFTKRNLESLTKTLTWWQARVIREQKAGQMTSCRGYRPAKCGGRVPWA